MSKNKDFNNIPKKPYDQLFDGVGYEKDFDDRNNDGVKDTMETINEVKPKPNSEDGSFDLSNYFRLLWMYFLDDAEEKLNPVEYAKADKFWTIVAIIFALVFFVIIGSYLF